MYSTRTHWPLFTYSIRTCSNNFGQHLFCLLSFNLHLSLMTIVWLSLSTIPLLCGQSVAVNVYSMFCFSRKCMNYFDLIPVYLSARIFFGFWVLQIILIRLIKFIETWVLPQRAHANRVNRSIARWR